MIDLDAIRWRLNDRKEHPPANDEKNYAMCYHISDYWVAVSDIDALLAEVNRLNAEVFNLQCEWKEHDCGEDR